MVIKITNTDSTYIDVSSSVKSTSSSSNTSMEEQIQKIVAYFDAVDGSPSAWDKAGPAMREAFHPDLIIETADSELTFNDIASMVRDKFIPHGCIADLVAIEDNGDGTATMVINNHLPNETGDVTRQLVYFRDGKGVRVRATDADVNQFGAMIDRVAALHVSEGMEGKIQQIRAYFDTIDGSPNAFENFKAELPRTIHPDLIIESSNGKEMGYAEFLALIRDRYMANGCITDLKDIEDNGDGTVTITVSNLLPGETGDITRQVMHFGTDGRVIRVHGEGDSNKAKFGSMLDRVAALPPQGVDDRLDDRSGGRLGMYVNIQEVPTETGVDKVAEKYRAFLESFVGSTDVSNKIEPMFEAIFDPSIVFFTAEKGHEQEDLEWFKFYIDLVVAKGHRTRDVKVKVVSHNQIQLDFYLVTDEKDLHIERMLAVRNGKVVMSKPVDMKADTVPEIIRILEK